MNEGANVDDQKMALRALVILSKGGAVALESAGGQLTANDNRVPLPLMGVRELLAQMSGHSVERVDVSGEAPPAEILGLARTLALAPTPGDGGAQVRQKLDDLKATHLTLAYAAPAPAATTLVIEKPDAGQRAAQDAAALIQQVAGKDVTKLTPEELFGRLDKARGAAARNEVLDDLIALAEHSMRVAKPAVVATIVHEIVAREGRARDEEARRAFGATFKRVARPPLLRAIAGLVAKRPERKQHYFEILARAGEDGADALIEQIAQATTAKDRKQFMEVFQELDAAVPALVRMLGDARWFVARNAADLLGELGAKQADAALVQLLRHTDERVRRSVTNALVKLGTADAVKGVYEAVNDTAPEVRIQAAAAMSTRRDARTSNTLIRAIEDEQDNEVQLALIAALGRVATPEAIQKLVRMAEPEQRLFRKKTTVLRVAAVQALAEANTPVALHALRTLAEDKEKEVRDVAARALVHSR